RPATPRRISTARLERVAPPRGQWNQEACADSFRKSAQAGLPVRAIAVRQSTQGVCPAGILRVAAFWTYFAIPRRYRVAALLWAARVFENWWAPDPSGRATK